MFAPEKKPENLTYISLQSAAEHSEIYSQEYLSLRARKGKLKAIKLGRNWVTTKAWVDEYIYSEKNVKANGISHGIVEKNIEKISNNKIVKTEVLEKTEKIKSEKIFFKKSPINNFIPAVSFAVASIIVILIFTFTATPFSEKSLGIKNELSNKVQESVSNELAFIIESSESFFSQAQTGKNNFVFSIKNYFGELSIAKDNFKKSATKKSLGFLDGQKNIAKEIVFENKNNFENFFRESLQTFSEKTKQILTLSKKGGEYLFSRSEKFKNTALIFYESPKYFGKEILQGILKVQQSASDYIAGFPLFIKDGIADNFLKIKNYSENSKIFLAEAGSAISDSLKSNRDGVALELKDNIKYFSESANSGVEKISKGINNIKENFKALGFFVGKNVKKGIWETRIFLVYFSNRVNDSLDFSSKPWNKKEELLVDNNTTPGIEKGMVVIPSQGEIEDEKIKKQIRESFSDEVEVKLKDADSGIITPVFKEKKGEDYMYLMVPIKN